MALSKVGKNQVDQSASLTVDGDLTVDTDTLYVNSANNKVAVGTASPSTKFHVQSAGDNYITSRDSTSGGIAGVILQNGSDTRGIRINGSSLQLHDHSANLTRLNIDASGRVTMPYQPLSVIGTTVNNYAPSAGDVLQFDYVSVNRGSAYNTSTYTFTCPVAGDYEVSLYFNRNGWRGDLKLEKNGSQVRRLELRTHGLNASSSVDWQAEQFSFIIPCSANDTLRWKCDYVYTSGYLLDGYNNHLFDTVTYRLVG